MARILGKSRNPDVFGEDLAALAWEAIGVGVAEVGDQRFAAPIIGTFVPLDSTSVAGKLLDAVTTGITAWIAGAVVNLVDRPIGRRIRRGGLLLATAKGISAFIPGVSLSGSIPVPASLPSVSAPAKPSAALPAPAGGTSAVQSSTNAVLKSVGSMGF